MGWVGEARLHEAWFLCGSGRRCLLCWLSDLNKEELHVFYGVTLALL